MKDIVLEVKELAIEYRTRKSVVQAVNGISFQVPRGTTMGLVGETGAGKTTTALGIMGLIPVPPGKVVSGEILFQGENLLEKSQADMRSIRGKRISMIFQDPMTALNPILTVGDQICEVIRLHEKLSMHESVAKAKEMLELVGIPGERYNDYPHQFSGGMKQRVVIAIALACNPMLLIADEPTTALDVTIQAQVLLLMNKLKKELGTSLILITHDLGVVAEMCSRVIVMYAGKIVEEAPVKELFASPAHPYTQGLIASVPKLGAGVKVLPSIPGACPIWPPCPRAAASRPGASTPRTSAAPRSRS